MDEKIKQYHRMLTTLRDDADSNASWTKFDAGLFEAYDIALAEFETLFMGEE